MNILITGDARFIGSAFVRLVISRRHSIVNFEKNLEKTVQLFLENQGWWQPLLSTASVGQRQGIKS